MTDALKMTEKQILSIGLNYPEKLYVTPELDVIKNLFRKLSMKWHPDKSGKATDAVFSHINVLYEKAVEKVEKGIWNKGNVVIFSTAKSTFELKYLVKKDFELGVNYIANQVVVWEFDKQYEDLVKNAIEKIESLRYANNAMEEEIKKYLPHIKAHFSTPDKVVVVIKKSPEDIVLRDVLNYYKNALDPKHVAWITSTMHHLCCFLKYNNLMHGGLTLDNYYINPKTHTASLLGGWWYAHTLDTKLKALSTVALDVAPVKVINNKKAYASVDLELIRLNARELLGDKTGIHLMKNKAIPQALIAWARQSSSEDAVAEYEAWQKRVLKDSFGVRRFTELPITANDIYSF